MSLTSGTRIGPFEVVSLVGVGGMGEVYRATDTHLKRAVAIKVLPAAVARDPDRLARFQREAEVLAALNHPNIAAIYGLEKTSDVTALVMELVDGEDLSALIARQGQTAPAAAGPSESAPAAGAGVGSRPNEVKSRGAAARVGGAPRAMSVDDALPIARQIVEAFEAAHEQGIIHRDLKPANIKVRADGTVKVLDFGLAKAMDPAGASSADAMNSPTLTARATHMGVIVGTAAYMAPEQARGRAVDKRADIWAFGVVLYEMLSGRRAFEGEDVSTILANVLKEDVRWDALPKGLPVPLGKLIRRCIERDPRQRLQAIGEARIAIDEVLAGGAVAESASPQPAAASRPLTWMAATAVLAALLLVSLATAVRHFRERLPVPATVAFDLAPPEAIGELRSYDAPVVSPDGRHVVLIGSKGLSIRAVGSTQAVLLAGIDSAASPFWSPDSRTIAYFQNTKVGGILKRVSISGGAPDAGVKLPWRGLFGAWGPDGTIVVVGQGRLHRIPAGGGAPSPLGPLDTARGETYQGNPSFLPDGRHLMYVSTAEDLNNATVRVRALDSNETTDLMSGVRDATYARAADGIDRLLFVRAGELWAQTIDLRALRLSGEPVRIATGIENLLAFGAAFSASTNGVLAYRVAAPPERSQLGWYDRRGKPLGTVGDSAIYSNPSLSVGDRWLAVSKLDERVGTRDIWVIDLVRKTARRLTLGDADDLNPVWSPDGREVAYSSGGGATRDVFRMLASGVGEPELVLKSPGRYFLEDWSLDGRDLLYNVNSSATWRVSPSGDGTPVAVSKGPLRQDQAQLSPDGRWLAYRETGSDGTTEVYVQTFPRGEDRWQISTAGGQQPRWRRDSRELFYVAGDQLMAVSVTARGSVFESGAPQLLFSVTFERAIRRNHYVVSADGQRFLVVEAVRSTAPPRMTAIVNWTVPTSK